MARVRGRNRTKGRNGSPRQADVFQLLVQHGGRCGKCNLDLTTNPTLFLRGNFSEIAHVIGASDDGPRGNVDLPLKERHTIENLIPLCPQDHKMVDDYPEEFPTDLLLAMKKDHVERIKRLTSLASLPRTLVVRCQINLSGQLVRATPSESALALIGRCPADADGLELDFSKLSADESPESLKTFARLIHKQVNDRIYSGVYRESVNHVSLFAIGPIPLLVSLGRSIGSAIETAYFHRDRASNSWRWPEEGAAVAFTWSELSMPPITDPDHTLIVSCSGPLRMEDLPKKIRSSSIIYEIRPKDVEPGLHLLRNPESVENFVRIFNDVKTRIRKANGHERAVNIMLAAPPSICVAAGQALLPKVDPAFLIYDLRKASGGFVPTIEVNE